MRHPSQLLWTEKAKRAMREKALSGTMPGCAPVGYRNVRRNGEKWIEVDPRTGRQVRALFRFVASGLSLRKAGLHAWGLGLRSRNGKAMGPSALHAVLTNPFYMGKLRYGGEIVQGTHEPLVTEKLFEAVQNRLRHRE